jgi:hypothetical protein
MRLKLTLLTLLVAGLAIPAAMGSTVNGTDKANASRACTTLRTQVGTTTFGNWYHTFGACTSTWVGKARSARVSATSTCQHRGLHGRVLASCISLRTKSKLNLTIGTFKNAAKSCAAEQANTGFATTHSGSSFAAFYGTNDNDANAFGKCVSMKASGKTPPTPSNNAAQHFTTTLTGLNGSGVSGSGTLLLNSDNKLKVNLSLSGLEANQSHEVAIRGMSSGNATCPTSSADTNHDNLISLSEAQPSVGNVLVALSTAQQAGEQLTASSSWLPLTTRTIVVLGKTVNGTYDATLPVACGTIAAAT